MDKKDSKDSKKDDRDPSVPSGKIFLPDKFRKLPFGVGKETKARPPEAMPPIEPLVPKAKKEEKILRPAQNQTAQGETSEGLSSWHVALSSLAAKFPDLKMKLKQAEMSDEPTAFIAKAMLFAVLLAVGLTVLFVFVFQATGGPVFVALPIGIIAFPIAFLWYMKGPQVRISKKVRELDKDLVFAGRHMLIELRAGVPLFDSMMNITSEYGEVSIAFSRILEKINVGVPADVAIHDISEEIPSQNFRRVMLQIVNSLRSGSNVADALEAMLEQLSKEQVIEVKSYGQKLNPLAMFYMIFGVILPSLGIALLLTLISFMHVDVGNELLLAMLFILGLVQFIFLSAIESTRPRFEV